MQKNWQDNDKSPPDVNAARSIHRVCECKGKSFPALDAHLLRFDGFPHSKEKKKGKKKPRHGVKVDSKGDYASLPLGGWSGTGACG